MQTTSHARTGTPTRSHTRPVTRLFKQLSLTATLIFASAAFAQPQGDGALPTIDSMLATPPTRQQGRVPFRIDDVQLGLARGTFTPPREAGGTWTQLTPDAEGWLSGPALAGGYAIARVTLPEERIAILNAAGHSMVYVNGEPRMGDPYANGTAQFPVLLRKGENELLFAGGRGRIRARFEAPPAPIYIQTLDATLPDAVIGEPLGTQAQPAFAGVIVTNANTEPTPPDLLIQTSVGDAAFTPAQPFGVIQPLSTRKVVASIATSGAVAEGPLALRVRLTRAGEVVHEASFPIEVVRSEQARRVTFVSDIDGSAQYYGYVAPASGGTETPGLVLTLHGASVEGISQARAYTPKTWTHIVAPTNRRPFGFDWEDWGRKDAIEVLDLAKDRYEPDPRRVWLTGHSMGGHGTWHLGVTYPDRFAAIAPSAGWISFWTYAGGQRPGADATGVLATLRDATNPSDTAALARNLAGLGVYILHGDADDNVPVGQARQMRTTLAEFHSDFGYYERKGAGHWWGNECVDWPALMEFFRARSRPERVDQIDFRTFSPGISASSDWATIVQQHAPGQLSRIELGADRAAGTIKGTTTNVRRLRFDLNRGNLAAASSVTLDSGEALRLEPGTTIVDLVRESHGGPWRLEAQVPGEKNPSRNGPFKAAFDRRFTLVFGTGGSEVEQQWMRRKARFDAEQWWYRGNGDALVLSDMDFLEQGGNTDQNVIVYGNASINSAWSTLLNGSPVDADSSRIVYPAADGARAELTGAGAAVLVVRPRAGSEVALVAGVGGVGLEGMRTVERLPYFSSGVAYPDWVVFGSSVLEKGSEAVVGAGWFGPDWR
jgi:predicted esterase